MLNKSTATISQKHFTSANSHGISSYQASYIIKGIFIIITKMELRIYPASAIRIEMVQWKTITFDVV